MRISPQSPSPAEASIDDARLDALAAESAEEQAPKTSPGEIDARRAQQLLERSASLAGRGDMGAALLATRQSLALAPTNIDGHLLLARLLERSRDFGGARGAYEKIVQLAPERADAHENLQRLNTYLEQSQGAARQFQFDSDELFGAKPTETMPVETVAAPAESDADSMEMLDQSMLPGLDARLPPTRLETPSEKPVEAPVAAVADADERVDDRRKNNVPVASERRRAPSLVAAIPVPIQAANPLQAAPLVAPVLAKPLAARASDNIFDIGAGLNAGVLPVISRAPLDFDIPNGAKVPLWQQVAARPSFFARTLPVVAVALLSLGFLSWARGRAVSKVVAPDPTALAASPGAQDVSMPNGTTDSGAVAPANNAANGAANGAAPATDAAGFPISNAPATSTAPPAPNAPNGAPNAATGNNAPSTARASNRANNNGNARAPRRSLPSPRPVPVFPGVSLAPAPIPSASVRSQFPSAAGQNGGGNIILPSPSIEMPSAPIQRQRVLPPTDNGLNPAGAPGRGYVRVTEGRVGTGVMPSQPGNVARENENNANASARSGQTDQAISQLSQAIRADSDNAGFRYQQRAMLFLQRGDYNRASDDFQSAISAYQSQISSGNNVAQAKSGLSSARSGLTLALAGKRG